MSFLLPLQDSLRQPQSFARVGVVRADLHPRQLRQRDLLRRIVEQHQRKRVPGILRADQMRQRHRNFLRRSEAVFAVKNHRMRTVEHQHRRARRLVLALMHLQVGVFDVERQGEPFALDRARERGGDVEIQRVAKLVGFRRAAGLDAGRQIARIMPPKTRLAERAQQVAQRLEAEKVEALVGDFELGLLRFASLSANARPA